MEKSNICLHCKQKGIYLGSCINCNERVCNKCGKTSRTLGFLWKRVQHYKEWCLDGIGEHNGAGLFPNNK